jgi:hypothetical protein
MNLAGFVPSGLLIAGFGASLVALGPRTTLSVVGALLVAIFGLGITGAGVYSCDPGCPRRDLSAEAAAHQLVSSLAFLAGLLALGIWAHRFRRLAGWRSMWRYTAASAVAALALLVVLDASLDDRGYAGVWQRLFLATLYLWCAVVGVRLFHQSRARVGARSEAG